MKNWYIIQSHSSFENKVAQLIKDEAEKAKISEKIEEVIVPTHDVTEVKRGKRVQRKKKYFPGYVLIKSSPLVLFLKKIEELDPIKEKIELLQLPWQQPLKILV